MVETKTVKWSEVLVDLAALAIFVLVFSYVAAAVFRSKDNADRIETLEATVTALTDDNSDTN